MKTIVTVLTVIFLFLGGCFGVALADLMVRARLPTRVGFSLEGEPYARRHSPDGLRAKAFGDKYGYVDPKGGPAIEPRFAAAVSFCEGLGLVSSGNGWGYIDERGDWVILPTYDTASVFVEGIADVVRRDAHYQIDKSERPVRLTLLQRARRILKANGVWENALFMMLAVGGAVVVVFAIATLGFALGRQRYRAGQRTGHSPKAIVLAKALFAAVGCVYAVVAWACWMAVSCQGGRAADIAITSAMRPVVAVLVCLCPIGMVAAKRAKLPGVLLFFAVHLAASLALGAIV